MPNMVLHPLLLLFQLQPADHSFAIQHSNMGGGLCCQEAWQLIDSTELMSITANLGDTRTTITHPYTTTHARWSAADKLEVGITESIIRIAVGLEDPQDLIEDLRF